MSHPGLRNLVAIKGHSLLTTQDQLHLITAANTDNTNNYQVIEMCGFSAPLWLVACLPNDICVAATTAG
jgi:hypothetical protein